MTPTRILLVEDDAHDARLVVNLLGNGNGNGEKFHIENVDCLGTATEKLREQAFDLLLLDLPVSDLPEAGAIKMVIQAAPELPIIVLTTEADQSVGLAALRQGAQDHLIKGTTQNGDLARAIRHAIARKQSARELDRIISDLQETNRQILARQASMIEEARCRVLVEMAGATAHELNQPVMTLLGTLEILRMDEPVPEGWDEHVARIETAGRRIADVVKKMSTIRKVESKPYAGGVRIIDLDQGGRVLVVEENDANYDCLRGYLERQGSFRVTRAETVLEAMQLLETQTFDLIYMDDVFPGGKGFDLLNWMEWEKIDVPVVAITGYGNGLMGLPCQNGAQISQRDTDNGQLPFLSDSSLRFDQFRERLAVMLDKAKDAALASLEIMARDMGSERFRSHNERVIQYLGQIGARLDIEPATIRSMQRAAVMHDFTKVLLGDFYDKAQLTEEERSGIENHPFLMAALVEPFDFFSKERSVMLWHHENYDGSGYPDGLKGDEIPLAARIFSIVDALVAMTSERPHRQANSTREAIRELLANAGSQFDPKLVDIVLDIIKEHDLLYVNEGKDGQVAQTNTAVE